MHEKNISFLHIALGILFFMGLALFLPEYIFSVQARLALATITLMIYWWITRPVPIAVTALLPIVINAVFNMSSMAGLLADYFSPIVVLLIGANVILASWSNSGLDKRIALKGLMLIGTSVKKQLVVWFAISLLMSMFLPNAVVAATFCPIAVAMVEFSFSKSMGKFDNSTLFLILLAIVWGAGIGGFGTPLGGAMNLVAIDYIESFTGREYMYIDWTLNMLPYLLTLAAGIILYFFIIKIPLKHLEGSREYFKSEYAGIGKAPRSQKIALVLFVASLALSFARPLYENLVPELKPYYAFLIMGLLAFFIRDENGKNIITWDYAVKKINWSLILLFSGGMAAGNLLKSTGAVDAIAKVASTVNDTSIYLFMFIFIVLGFFLADTSSNTAATSVLIPIVISIFAVIALDPLPYAYIAAAACNCAFILPTSIRAIPVGLGLDVRFMFKRGLAAVAVSLAVLTAAAFIRIALLH